MKLTRRNTLFHLASILLAICVTFSYAHANNSVSPWIGPDTTTKVPIFYKNFYLSGSDQYQNSVYVMYNASFSHSLCQCLTPTGQKTCTVQFSSYYTAVGNEGHLNPPGGTGYLPPCTSSNDSTYIAMFTVDFPYAETCKLSKNAGKDGIGITIPGPVISTPPANVKVQCLTCINWAKGGYSWKFTACSP